MKVFLSWSGETSHKVALVLRDWSPSVLQSIEPYVSSEDIDKGARWSTDIAHELEDSSYGILCVTKANLVAPWLTFEAGALSKTIDKSFVSPFLFDIKRADVHGPILQFQSTILEKDDLLKLCKSLNKAAPENQLEDARLDRAFEVWYPKLESSLARISVDEQSAQLADEEDSSGRDTEIMEEILDLTRLNQKLLRDPDRDMSARLAEMLDRFEYTYLSSSAENRSKGSRRRKIIPPKLENLMSDSFGIGNGFLGFQILLGIFKEDLPWLADSGHEVIRVLRSGASKAEKEASVHSFLELAEFSSEHSYMREIIGRDKEVLMILRELPYLIRRVIDERLDV